MFNRINRLHRSIIGSSLNSINSFNNNTKLNGSNPIRNLQILRTVEEFRSVRKQLKQMHPNNTLGLVPTMGALHSGHLELVHNSQLSNNNTVVSIYVNPTQFAANEDLSKYPRTLENDCKLLESIGTDYLFAPIDNTVMYNPDHSINIDIGNSISEFTYEGKSRPNHFNGVATVVTKLFNIIQPDRAYFGQKDGIQCIVINKLVRELNIPIEINIIPTIREPDGLAMSSRNRYLSIEQRAIAPIVYQSLITAESAYHNNNNININQLKQMVESVIASSNSAELSLQYVSIADLYNGRELTDNESIDPLKGVLLSIAVKLGTTRLIDNLILKQK